jgi:hypothetical protein
MKDEGFWLRRLSFLVHHSSFHRRAINADVLENTQEKPSGKGASARIAFTTLPADWYIRCTYLLRAK